MCGLHFVREPKSKFRLLKSVGCGPVFTALLGLFWHPSEVDLKGVQSEKRLVTMEEAQEHLGVQPPEKRLATMEEARETPVRNGCRGESHHIPHVPSGSCLEAGGR